MTATPFTRASSQGSLSPWSRWESMVRDEEISPLLRDWAQWLSLSKTPDVRPGSDPLQVLSVWRGTIADPLVWPNQPFPRIYVAYDDTESVYVGQTSQPLPTRIRRHLTGDSLDHRIKAGTWEFVVSAAFDGLAHGGLDRLEAAAAAWVLSPHRRIGRRHPAH